MLCYMICRVVYVYSCTSLDSTRLDSVDSIRWLMLTTVVLQFLDLDSSSQLLFSLVRSLVFAFGIHLSWSVYSVQSSTPVLAFADYCAVCSFRVRSPWSVCNVYGGCVFRRQRSFAMFEDMPTSFSLPCLPNGCSRAFTITIN